MVVRTVQRFGRSGARCEGDSPRRLSADRDAAPAVVGGGGLITNISPVSPCDPGAHPTRPQRRTSPVASAQA